MRSGRHVWLAGALLAPALIVSGVVPRVPVAASGSTVKAGDIVFVNSLSGTPYVAFRDASTGNVTTLAAGAEPAVSPDGSKIAFITAADDANRCCNTLHIMNSDGSGVIELVPHAPAGSDDEDPRWSPDGQWIVFNRIVLRPGVGDAYEIDTVRADGTHLSTVASVLYTSSDPREDQYPTWSPTKGANGSYRIAFMNYDPSAGAHLFIVNADGSKLHLASTVKTIQGSTVFPFYPNWSPDGSRIYFVQDAGSTAPIDYYSSTDDFTASDATVHQLQAGTQATSLHLSADGSTLLYYDDAYGATTLSTSGTGTPVPVPNALDEHDPSFVPATWPNANTKNLVALGDSVAAGEGINYGFIWTGSKWTRTGPSDPTWMDTTPALGANYQQCHQSWHGYPNLIALNGGNYQVFNMACTGASALQNNTSVKPEDGGVLDPEQFNSKDQPYPENSGPNDPTQAVPAELGGISKCNGCSPLNKYFNKHNPDIVLLTMGANDVDFPYWVLECYKGIHACNTEANTKLVDSQLAIAKADLLTAFGQLNKWAESKSKQLKVLVTNYYDPMNGNNDSCRDYKLSKFVLLTGAEIAWLEQGLTDLNANIAADVKTAQNRDTHLTTSLVDLSNIMSGHQWCAPDPWAYGTSIDYSLKNVFLGANPAPFHPTPKGQEAIYQAVDAVLNSPA